MLLLERSFPSRGAREGYAHWAIIHEEEVEDKRSSSSSSSSAALRWEEEDPQSRSARRSRTARVRRGGVSRAAGIGARGARRGSEATGDSEELGEWNGRGGGGGAAAAAELGERIGRAAS